MFVLNAVFGLWCSTLWSYISALILCVQRPLLQKNWCCYICNFANLRRVAMFFVERRDFLHPNKPYLLSIFLIVLSWPPESEILLLGVFWSELGMYFQCISHSWEDCGIVLAFTEVLTLAVTCIWLLDSSCNLLKHLIPIEAITVYLIFHMTVHTVCGPEESQSFCMWLANFAKAMQFCHLYCP